MILSKPRVLVRLAKVCKSTSAEATAPYKIKVASENEMNYAKKYEFTPPASHHDQNPHFHAHLPSPKWKKAVYVCVPLIVALTVRAIYVEMEEEKHVHEHRPEYVPVEYMRIQRTPFPWGDGKHTLFHNPTRNPVPGVGYEA